MEARLQPVGTAKLNVSVRALQIDDLPAADHVMRLAFGTFLGLHEPTAFMGDAEYVRARWLARPGAAYGAELDGQIVGSNFATNWGSVGFFGPLTIRPDLWDRGIGKRLMEPILSCFDDWGTTHAGLFTFANSQKHVCLYQQFGFWPRFLTPIMSKPVARVTREPQWTKFSDVPEHERGAALLACRKLTNSIYDGLDLESEMRAVADQNLGDTVLLGADGNLSGLAICHCGPRTEAGSGACFVKFGAVRMSTTAARDFEGLLDACEELATQRGLSRLVAGVNTACHEAYRQMLERGFRTELQGVAMHRQNEPGYHRAGVYVIDDWR
jgi:GNAT superfamily N-acetyltransferase